MGRDIKIKTAYLIVMALFLITTGVGVCSGDISYPSRSATADAQFVATVSGTNVDFDWSAMVAANSYSMAVALSEADDNIDVSTLNFLDMGTRKTFSTSGLPSGMIFYAVILADTDQGLVVSNIAEFMPFAGTVSFPTSGEVLMQLDDPGGIGTITVSGVENVAEETMTISQISGDDGSGPFVLTVVDDKPATYTKDDLTMNFTYAADGTVVVQGLRSSERTEDNLSDCQQTVLDNISDLTARYIVESNGLASVFHMLRLMTNSVNSNNELFRKLADLSQIYYSALEGVRDKFMEDRAVLDKEYEACIEEPEPEPDPNPDNPVITIDTSCSIPQGAERHEAYYADGSMSTLWYTLNGYNVGPYEFWSKLEDGSPYLANQSCRNVDGQLNGWQIWYNSGTGKMNTAIPYENGIANGHRYDFHYESGSLVNDITMVNGIETYRLQYAPDGSLYAYCDCDGDGVWHFISSN